MKFGVFYELQLPRPWGPDDEHQLYQNALNQVELADQLGYDYAWQVEHHFLEEYSHSPTPEMFLAAASQRTKNIRLAHGIMQLTTSPPARVAERIATLDLLSNGRAEFGSGESASVTELEPFGRMMEDKRAIYTKRMQKLADYATNPNIALVSYFMCAETDEEARRRADGATFFQFALRFYGAATGRQRPRAGTVNMWDEYNKWKRENPDNAARALRGGLIGSPETIRAKLRKFEASNIDQIILLNQAGKNSHADICESLELFGREVMPEFQGRHDKLMDWKAKVLSGETLLEEIDTTAFTDRYGPNSVQVALPKTTEVAAE